MLLETYLRIFIHIWALTQMPKYRTVPNEYNDKHYKLTEKTKNRVCKFTKISMKTKLR